MKYLLRGTLIVSKGSLHVEHINFFLRWNLCAFWQFTQYEIFTILPRIIQIIIPRLKSRSFSVA
jgi:hypothetical protein